MFENSLSSKERREKILATATGGICIATSFVLSWIKVFTMPQGGTITPASMLPIFFFALCFGPAWGLGAAFVFGLLQLIGGYFLMPAQVFLDYILAFTVLGIAGFFAAPKAKRITQSNIIGRLSLVPIYKMILGVLCGIFLRFVCAVFSGVIFFAEFAGNQNPWIYSIVYNGTYLLPEAMITIVILLAVMLPLPAIRLKNSTPPSDE